MNSGDTVETNTKTWRVMIADDHSLVCEGISLLIDAQPDMEVVAKAKDGDEAWRLAREVAPDVIVMDVVMPKLTGAQATERLRTAYPQVRVLAMSAYTDDIHVRQMMMAGVSGYLSKSTESSELVKAIRMVAGGDVYLDSNISGEIVEGVLKPPLEEETLATLSAREIEILLMVAHGHSNIAIAQKLHYSVKNIEGYKSRIKEKMGFRSRTDLVRYVIKRGWFDSQTIF